MRNVPDATAPVATYPTRPVRLIERDTTRQVRRHRCSMSTEL